MDGTALTKVGVIPIIHSALEAAGINTTNYAEHSFRKGAATTAVECRIEDSIIQTMG